jgi:hypothetical protein
MIMKTFYRARLWKSHNRWGLRSAQTAPPTAQLAGRAGEGAYERRNEEPWCVHARALGPLSLNPSSLVTIRMQEIHRSLSANYTHLLNEVVFNKDTIREKNRKIIRSFKRILENDEANSVLTILWRESSYVTEDELSHDGFAKLFLENPLTTYHLAVHLASGKNEVAATNSRVRLIVAAGAAFGLVTKKQLTRTKVYIFGTELLHDFMVRLGFENASSCAQILWQDPQARISPQSFLGVPFMPPM